MTLKKLVKEYRENGTEPKIIKQIYTYYKKHPGKLQPHLVKQLLQDRERYMPMVKETLQEESKNGSAVLIEENKESEPSA